MNNNSTIYQSGQYQQKNPTWHQEDSAWKVQQIQKVLTDQFIKDNFNQDKTIKIVDFGCGAGGVIGSLSKALQQKEFRVKATGFDISEQALAMARKNWPEIDFIKGDIGGTEEKYDLGFLIDVIEHVDHPNELIKKCAQKCQYLISHIPLDDNFNNRSRNKFEQLRRTVGHIHYFNAKSAEEILTKNNLEIIKQIYTRGFLLPSARQTWKAQLVMILKLILNTISKSWCARVLGGYSLMILTKKD